MVFKHIDDMTFIEGPHSNGYDRLRRNAVVNPDALWPGGIIPYRISNYFSGELENSNNMCDQEANFVTDDKRRVILQAMHHWEENTCIRFRPKLQQDTHSIFIARGTG